MVRVDSMDDWWLAENGGRSLLEQFDSTAPMREPGSGPLSETSLGNRIAKRPTGDERADEQYASGGR
jgi:hypothetical protein